MRACEGHSFWTRLLRDLVRRVIGQHIVTPLEVQITATSSKRSTGNAANSSGRSNLNSRSASMGVFSSILAPKWGHSTL
jgi:hypothetical protein